MADKPNMRLVIPVETMDEKLDWFWKDIYVGPCIDLASVTWRVYPDGQHNLATDYVLYNDGAPMPWHIFTHTANRCEHTDEQACRAKAMEDAGFKRKE